MTTLISMSIGSQEGAEARELRRHWITALTSGKYKQGHGALVRGMSFFADNEDRYCCLGVACQVNNEIVTRNGEYYFDPLNSLNDSKNLSLPEVLRKKMLLSIEQQNILISLNDGGSNFDMIAKVIGTFDYWTEA